ncbi:NAD(P)-dependent oxidoreductase [Candidatus Nitrospira nitrificans]|uniref:NAD-dependent epimerase/dehydratase n=1 Tax=Candidatus Nitrospira nitrificans TaxID=1742973 RepID=A0A0S4LA90_9BACT|nr:NAD(P)H-binding protein [Candidatus Nitrospira nitrificans]CUS32742.1 NAD-dependent epimerase/dehydratase [Candidatus Nitrospira nitrificans]
MKITIIGASAGIGLQCTRLALAKGHEITTLSRRIVPLPDRPKLKMVQGSATKLNDVRTAVQGAEAVLVTLGVKSPFATTLFSDSARLLLQVLQETNASPTLLVLTGFGAGDSSGYNSLPMRLLFTLLLKNVYADKSEQERLIAGGYSRWEIVRPGRLTNGAMTGHYRILDSLVDGMKVGAVSRSDVAHFMLAQAEHPTYLGKYPALTY